MSNKKQRFISTSFWDDEWIQSIPYTERYLYLYLLTNTLTNIAGVYKISIRRMVFDTGIRQSTIEKILLSFTESRKAIWTNGYIILPAWPQHQKWNKSDMIRKGIESILESLPHYIIKCLVFVEYRYPLDTLFIPPLWEPCYLDLDLDFDLDLDSNGFFGVKKNGEGFPIKKATEYTPDFSLFWKTYPKKKKKIDAFKAWRQVEADRPPVNVIIEKLIEMKQTEDWTKENGQYIPHPASWLRAGSWDDETGVEKTQPQRPDNYIG